MQRRAQTELAVLGALSIEPMTGYGLRSAIIETLGHFWSESFGQIYPTLARLEVEGLVRRTSAGKTSGSVFELTEPGLEQLRVLLSQPQSQAPPRNGLLLRLFFGRLLDRSICESMLRDALEVAERQVAYYAALRAEVEVVEGNENTPFWVITIAAGQHHAAAEAAWARESLALLADKL